MVSGNGCYARHAREDEMLAMADEKLQLLGVGLQQCMLGQTS